VLSTQTHVSILDRPPLRLPEVKTTGRVTKTLLRVTQDRHQPWCVDAHDAPEEMIVGQQWKLQVQQDLAMADSKDFVTVLGDQKQSLIISSIRPGEVRGLPAAPWQSVFVVQDVHTLTR
jgi:hypothetical protein